MRRDWFITTKNHKSKSESVAWEQVLKTYLYCSFIGSEVITTNAEISIALNVSESVINSAKNVLKNEFGAIVVEVINVRESDTRIRTIGHKIKCSAWWES